MVRAVPWVLLLVFSVCHLSVCHGRASAQAEIESADDSELASDAAAPITKPKLDRRTRIELMFILVMLVAVGLGLIAFTWLTARLTRRYMKPSEMLPARRPDPVFTDDWASKPLTEQERAKLDGSEW